MSSISSSPTATLPNLSLVRISHDHMGSFGTALAGVNTPETQQADCDLALGLLVEAVANSPYADDTLIVAIEDDVQDGPDHVDSHRGTIFFAGPYVKKGGVVVNTHYSQVNLLRTIEDILGTEHINLNTAFQRPMADVFDIRSSGDVDLRRGGVNGARDDHGGQPDQSRSALRQGPDDQAEARRGLLGQGHRRTSTSPKPIGCRSRSSIAVLWAGLKGNTPYPALRGQLRNDLPPHLAWMQWR